MTVPITSRYRGLDVYAAADATGTVHPTVAIRRYAPPPAALVTYQHLVTGLDGIEDVAWRFFQDSEAWWRIADTNPLAFPLDLRPGQVVSVPATGQPGRISRERVF
ncbi:hypothetical protein [Phytohabitans rumicis]|uniref:LysM domain-containing protein n=1 Tax=Phytohabitans rumicis TaxID=1076125 RepID=A0A6V8LM80_9ACTN|nr:hypothetical protein [Phytohabitans rumicis]GFJ95207.1 hypothetical protein Prum_088490 [Phytohabitans rumicis]